MRKSKRKPGKPIPKKKIFLKEDSRLNQEIIDKLEELFVIVSPQTLKKSVNFVFFQYLFYAEDWIPSNFKHITEDFYFLQKFLEEAGEKLDEPN